MSQKRFKGLSRASEGLIRAFDCLRLADSASEFRHSAEELLRSTAAFCWPVFVVGQ